MLKILVVEDDVHIAEMIKHVLKDEYEITIAYNGEVAITLMEEQVFDLLITDIVMPNIDGYELLDYLNDVDSQTPTVILSSLNSESNQIKGYKYEIEEYIVKPFNAELFKGKINRILKRLYSLEESGVIINQKNKSVQYNETIIEFTPLEFDVYYYLFMNKGKYCNRYDILLHFWDDESNDRVVDHIIKRIRKKLGKYAVHISTKPKVGYMYEEG